MQSNAKPEVGAKPPDQISRLINAKRAPAPLPEGVRDSTRRLVEVPIEQVGRSPQQARHAVHEEDPKVRELALSIKALGLLVPITIRRDPERPGAYLLVMGESRLTAHRLLAREDERFKTITALLAEGATTDAEASFMGLAENINRSELTPLEEGEEYARQIGRGETADTIALKLGLKRDRVKRCLTLSGAPEAMRKVLREGCLVPRYGEDGKPLLRGESTPAGEAEGGAGPATEEGADRVQRHRVKVTDLVLQLTLVTLYLHLERNAKSKRHLEESFQRHLDKIVGQGFSVRAAQAYVKDVGAGRKPRATPEAAEKGELTASPPEAAPARRPAGFRSSPSEFYVDRTRLEDLTGQEREDLVGALRELLAQLGG